MRFSTQMMYQQNMRGITNSQAEWMKYGEQMSTGKRVVNPSDDPIAASQAVVLSQAQAQNSQYTLARTFATQKVSLEESVLSQVTTAIQNAQEKIVYASNGTLSDDDRASLATDIQGLRDQLLIWRTPLTVTGATFLPVITQRLRRLAKRKGNTSVEQKVLNDGRCFAFDGDRAHG